MRAAVKEYGEVLWDPFVSEPVEIVITVKASDAVSGIELCTPTLDLIVDDLSFQLQCPLKVCELEILDVTEPVAIGDDRDMLIYPLPNGYDQYKLSRSVAMGNVTTVTLPALRDSYESLPRRTQDALDWYIKALHAQFDVDKYIFYWIAFEVLSKAEAESVEEPTRLRCGHTLANCLECGKSTSQFRQAATAIKFIESFGVDTPVAKRLWGMRQLVHGAKSFLPEKLKELGELTQVLRYVTASALKKSLGIDQDGYPVVGAGAPSVGVPVGLGGRRPISVRDL